MPLLALASSCATLHRVREDRAPPVVLRARLGDPAAADEDLAGRRAFTPARGQVALEAWWRVFGDPVLDGLVAKALGDNLDLARTRSRLRQAEGIARGASAQLWPQVNAGLGAGALLDVGAREVMPGALAGGLAAYEVDLWGRLAHLERSSGLEVDASREDVEALAMTLSAEVALAWFELLEGRESLALTSTQASRLSALADELAGPGVERAEAARAALELEARAADLAARQASELGRVRLLEHRLAALLAEAPGPGVERSRRTLPGPLPRVDGPIPSSLLERRPDVRAARLRVVSADHRVGAAIAARWPALRLEVGLLAQLADPAALISGLVGGLAASLAGPVVDGGRGAAGVARQRAALDERVAAFGQAVLVAAREVEDSLEREVRAGQALAARARHLVAARASLALARAAYARAGLAVDAVLEALDRLTAAERAALDAHGRCLAERVGLARALGGGWPPPGAPDSGRPRG